MDIWKNQVGDLPIGCINRFKVLVCGDDSLIGYPPEIKLTKDLVVNSFVRLGFVSKPKFPANVLLGSFCSNYMHLTEIGAVAGPKPGKLLFKLGFSVERILDPMSWVRGVAMGLIVTCSHIYVVRVFLRHMLRLTTRASNVAPIAMKSYQLQSRCRHDPGCGARQQWLDRYGFDPIQLEDELEVLFNRVQTLPAMISHPWLYRMIEVDV